MAGRQLPDELHALKGTVAEPRKPNLIPLALLGGRPTCPQHLSKPARRAWLAAIKLLEARGTLDPGAGPTLLIYAVTMARWLEAKADLDKNGLMIEVTKATSKGELYTTTAENPMLKIAENAEAQLLAITKSLGISPEAREKVRKVKQVARAGVVPAWLADLQAKETKQ